MKRIALGGVCALTLVGVVLPFVIPPAVRLLGERLTRDAGYPCQVAMDLGYGWHGSPELVGALRVRLRDTPWRINADFSAGFGRWQARVTMPETGFSEADPTLVRLLKGRLPSTVSNLVFSGHVSLDATVERTRRLPVPVWNVRLPLRDVTVGLTLQDRDIRISDLDAVPALSGIADRLDNRPMRLHVGSILASGFTFTNLTARLLTMEQNLLVTEAAAGFCGGRISLYSAFLDPRSLDAGLTLFMEDVEAGEIIRHFNGFRGSASGRLHGKMRLFAKEGGRAIRFSNGFLYSTPGETGKLRLEGSTSLSDSLSLAGLDTSARDNVAKALQDLDYSVLRFDLRRHEDRNATLGIRIRGSASRGSLTVPVDLTVNINGQIEQIINTGLGYSRKTKGPQK